MTEIRTKEHFNLYYIFKADQAEHPMPPHRAEAIRKEILKEK